jgi:hypothetical protein
MVLGFLAIVRETDVDVVLRMQEERGSGCKGDTFVCWTEYDVKLGKRIRGSGECLYDCICVCASESGEDGACGEETGVDEVW